MPRPVAALLVALALGAACSNGSPSLSDWCGLVADGAVVPLDAPDAPARWSELEASAPDDLRADVERLRVAAQQVAGLEADDVESATRLVLNPLVMDAHQRVVTSIGSRCRIDVSTMSVIELA